MRIKPVAVQEAGKVPGCWEEVAFRLEFKEGLYGKNEEKNFKIITTTFFSRVLL